MLFLFFHLFFSAALTYFVHLVVCADGNGWKKKTRQKKGHSVALVCFYFYIYFIENLNYLSLVNKQESNVQGTFIYNSHKIFILAFLLFVCPPPPSSPYLLPRRFLCSFLCVIASASWLKLICSRITFFPLNLFTSPYLFSKSSLSVSLALVLFLFIERCHIRSQEYHWPNTLHTSLLTSGCFLSFFLISF